MRIPEDTKEFAINMSNQRLWAPPVTRYIDECLAGRTGPRGKDFNMRCVASMVADVHRILTRGGIFSYPLDAKCRDKGGKLRLMYEANPMSLLVEQAGGAASTGRMRMLEPSPFLRDIQAELVKHQPAQGGRGKPQDRQLKLL